MDKNQDTGAISLTPIPKDKEYEEYVAALLQCKGYYLERSIILRPKSEIFELDIVANNHQSNKIDRILIEIKSKGWGMPDIFKVVSVQFRGMGMC